MTPALQSLAWKTNCLTCVYTPSYTLEIAVQTKWRTRFLLTVQNDWSLRLTTHPSALKIAVHMQ